ncbi:short-chain alcohol dehydrogenase-like protein [Hahella chejuensis KCTC 2396]|uniref:Short-chain alcohol dehydrogenase-like protein n=1 Tax=Hahella chejuensis (strain KCTC 2396) TaxID=349521 RepID=Q2SAC0_HAHCH|nr:NAD(P)-dependent oxidoreductase [Hahella chejuensis]ABC32404.1 short-chain alcohol dehydrogenase-like protein [Hahella chejuensis KCTC 2396]
MQPLHNKTIIITGASRGIGRAMALRFARDGANVTLAAKSAEPHPKLPGTIHSVAQEVEQAGGKALPVQLDVRDENAVKEMVERTAAAFGGVDAVINNAGAIKLSGVEHTPMKRFDLMHQVNTRAVMATAQAALPWLKKSGLGHILNLSPPVNLNPKWFAQYSPYTLTKYSMSMLTLGMAQEFRRYNIAVNSLWPQTLIATAAVEFEAGGKQALDRARSPEIMADAAYAILSDKTQRRSGEWLIDEQVLRDAGVTDFSAYTYNPDAGQALMTDLFVD